MLPLNPAIGLELGMSESPVHRVRAQDFYDFHKCPHRVYLNRLGDPKKRRPLSDFLNLIFERALLHEQDVLKDLPFDSPEGATIEEQFVSTLRLMTAGAERIFQGVLLGNGISGRPDLLERVAGRSHFGDFYYKPVDIKSGSGYLNEEKGTLREDYGLMLYHYGALLQNVQKFFPPEGEILNRKKQRVLYRLADFATPYAKLFPEILALVGGKATDEPVRCGDCGECQWWNHCESVLLAASDLSLLPKVGRDKRMALHAAGLRAIPDVINFDFDAVQIKGIGPATADLLKRSARALTTGKLEILSKPLLPDAPLKIYFDFEDDPTQELVYLCGMWVEPAIRGLNYHGLFAEDEAKEALLWADFQAFCAEIEAQDYVVFHYSGYEKVKLAQLERKHGLKEKAALENFRSRMVDLRKIVEDSVVLPERGYGLKKVAPYAGHKYTDEKAGGAQSMVWFHEYQQNPNDSRIIQTLQTYNQEDCQALKAICEWLKTLA